MEPRDQMQPEGRTAEMTAPSAETTHPHPTRDEIRAMVAARSWVIAVRAVAFAAAFFCFLPSVGIVAEFFSRATLIDSELLAVLQLEILALGVFLALPRVPRQALAILKWALLVIVALMLTSQPLADLAVQRFDPVRVLPVLFFILVVGLALFALDSSKLNRWTRGAATALALLAFVGLGAIFSGTGWGITIVACLAVLVALAQSRVNAAWPAIERYPHLFASTRRFRKRLAASGPLLVVPRVRSGIARSYGKWRELSKPAIRTGGVGGLGMR